MINRILTAYARQLENYLAPFFRQPEGMVDVAPITEQAGNEPAKLILSLTSLQRETGVAPPTTGHRPGDGKTFGATYPPLYMNMNIVMAAVYPPKRYRESLAVLTRGIECVQANPSFRTDEGTKYTIEIMDALPETNNRYAATETRHYPWVACKIRRLTFDSQEIKRTLGDIRTTEYE